MAERRISAQGIEVGTFEGAISIRGLDEFEKHHATASLSSAGTLWLHGWTQDQLRALAECASFLAYRIDETHASNGDAEPQAATPPGVKV